MSPSLPRHLLRHADGRRLYVYGELRGQLPAGEVPATPPPLHQRWDALTGTWVAISPARNGRPNIAVLPLADHGECPLCPGGPEVPFSYEAAVFENCFPTLVEEPPLPESSDPRIESSFGRCEVVLYTEAHSGSLGTLDPAEVCRVVAVWCDRSQALWADPEHPFVLVFENRGEEVGATLSHPHGQIYAFGHLPPLITSRMDVFRWHRRAKRECLGCAVANDDAASDRVVVKNDAFAVAVPFAARWPYEVHVRARRHGLRRLGDLAPAEQVHLAAALQEVVQRYDGLFGHELPYMMTVLEAPDGADDWHLAVEFLPPHRGPGQLKVRASVETATGMFMNDTLPESSASELAAVKVEEMSWAGVSVPAVTHPIEAQPND
ncbi:MAG: galactose-1-phosphate uridylyltransferase [Egibacteraceae bacterium]